MWMGMGNAEVYNWEVIDNHLSGYDYRWTEYAKALIFAEEISNTI